MDIFGELVDSGLRGCSGVVGVNRRKESHFGVHGTGAPAMQLGIF